MQRIKERRNYRDLKLLDTLFIFVDVTDSGQRTFSKNMYSILLIRIINGIDIYPLSCIGIVESVRKRCGENGLLVQSRLPQGSYRPMTNEFFPFEPIQIGRLLSKPINKMNSVII